MWLYRSISTVVGVVRKVQGAERVGCIGCVERIGGVEGVGGVWEILGGETGEKKE